MPDAGSVAASHDIVQMLFYFVCALAVAISVASASIFRFILLPLKDGALDFFKHQVIFMDTMVIAIHEMKSGDAARSEMHKQNLEKLVEIREVQEEIRNKIRCPVEYKPPMGAAGHA